LQNDSLFEIFSSLAKNEKIKWGNSFIKNVY
jgi:hypothetical protein